MEFFVHKMQQMTENEKKVNEREEKNLLSTKV